MLGFAIHFSLFHQAMSKVLQSFAHYSITHMQGMAVCCSLFHHPCAKFRILLQTMPSPICKVLQSVAHCSITHVQSFAFYCSLFHPSICKVLQSVAHFSITHVQGFAVCYPLFRVLGDAESCVPGCINQGTDSKKFQKPSPSEAC